MFCLFSDQCRPTACSSCRTVWVDHFVVDLSRFILGATPRFREAKKPRSGTLCPNRYPPSAAGLRHVCVATPDSLRLCPAVSVTAPRAPLPPSVTPTPAARSRPPAPEPSTRSPPPGPSTCSGPTPEGHSHTHTTHISTETYPYLGICAAIIVRSIVFLVANKASPGRMSTLRH